MTQQINFHSQEWIQTYERAASEIQQSISELCSVSVTHERSAFLRGRIDSLRSMIEIDKARFVKFSVNPFPQ